MHQEKSFMPGMSVELKLQIDFKLTNNVLPTVGPFVFDNGIEKTKGRCVNGVKRDSYN